MGPGLRGSVLPATDRPRRGRFPCAESSTSCASSFVLAVAAPAAPARADWPPTGYPLCNVPEDLGVPIGLSNTICFFGCGRSLALFWQDGRSNFGSIYTAGVNDAQPPDPPPVSEATLYLQRPGTQTPGGVVPVDFVQCLSEFCSAPSVLVWTDAPDTIPILDPRPARRR